MRFIYKENTMDNALITAKILEVEAALAIIKAELAKYVAPVV